MTIRLIAIEGPDLGKVYDVTARGMFHFGRDGVVASKGELPEDPYCSRVHALLEVAGPTFLLSDIGSRNGTYVNGEKLPANIPREMRHGDRLKAGRTILRVEIVRDPDPPPLATPPPASPPAPPAPPVPPESPAPEVTPQTRADAKRPLGDVTVKVARPAGSAPAPEPAVVRARSPGERTSVLPSRAEHAKARAAEAAASSTPPPSAAPLPPAPRNLSRPISDFSRGVKIGEGGASKVYRGVDNQSGETVAIKFMHPRRDLPPEAVALFLREIDLHARLVHPHIVGVVARGQASDGKPWLVLEYVDGRDLEDRVKASGPLSVEEALRVADGVLQALAHAHAQQIVHRDVKPANVLLKGPLPLTALLADFGIAKSMQNVGGATMTETGTIRGTIEYMAPEQLEDSKRVGPPADVYGAAATLYYALSGACHLDGPLGGYPGFRTVIDEKTKRIPLATRRAGLPPALCAAIDRGLARLAADRFATAEEFRQALLAVRG